MRSETPTHLYSKLLPYLKYELLFLNKASLKFIILDPKMYRTGPALCVCIFCKPSTRNLLFGAFLGMHNLCQNKGILNKTFYFKV